MDLDGFFVTSTGTATGKTFVTRGIAHFLTARGITVAAIKPIETGCDPSPLDAIALAGACANPSLALASGLYRAKPPLSPYAVTLQTGLEEPDVDRLAARVRELGEGSRIILAEGAGGLLVPLGRKRTMADLALALDLPLLVVARDCLGVLSHCLTVCESAASRGLPIAAVVLVRHEPGATGPDPGSNRAILADMLDLPVLGFDSCQDDDHMLASAAEKAGLSGLIAGPRPEI